MFTAQCVVTGAGDPLTPVSETLARKAAAEKARYDGSSRAIPLTATKSDLRPDLVDEIYHPGYAAKRMEIGAVVGAAPAENVMRRNTAGGR